MLNPDTQGTFMAPRTSLQRNSTVQVKNPVSIFGAKLFHFRTGYFSTEMLPSAGGWYRNCGVRPATKRGRIVRYYIAGLAHFQKVVCETENSTVS